PQPEPERAAGSIRNGLDPPRRQALLGPVAREPPRLEPGQASAVRAGPEAPVARFVERDDEGIPDRRRVGAVEHREPPPIEPRPVEPRQALIGAEPEIPVAGRRQRVHGILGKALVGRPRLVDVPVEGLRGIERERAEAAGSQSGANAPNPDNPTEPPEQPGNI